MKMVLREIHGRSRVMLVERFFSKVVISEGCWNWRGAILGNGYGAFSFRRRNHYAHRISWLLSRGAIGSSLILHHCDNPRCVRPSHLFSGNYKDNALDMVRKGRNFNPGGESHPRAKLRLEEVRKIREKFDGGCRGVDLASQYHVDKTTISKIVTGHNWRNHA